MQLDQARITLPRRDDLTSAAQAAYDLVAERIGMNPVWQAMSSSPAVEHVAQLAAYLVGQAPDRALNELAICVTTHGAGCDVEHEGHLAWARRAGVPEETLSKVGTPAIEEEPFPYGPVARFARLTARGELVDDATMQVLRERLGEPTVVHLLLSVGFYLLIARFVQQTNLTPILRAHQEERARRRREREASEKPV